MQTVVVLLTPAADHHGLSGTREFALPGGRVSLTFQYDVVRLWQLPAESILNGPMGLLPLAFLSANVDRAETIVAEMDRRLRAEANPKEAETLWTAAYFLMGLRYDAETVAKLIPKGRHMKESTTYQATLEEGRQEGRQKGQQEGRQEEALRLLLRLGRKTLGSPAARIRERLDALDDVNSIETLIERINDVTSWDELMPGSAARKSRRKRT